MTDIALLGFGTVGGGVADLLLKNKKLIASRLGDDINIKYILDLRDFPDSPFADRIVHDFSVILADPDVRVVAEMMGGVHPAADFTRAALEAGKSVVTSNKAVVADCGDELLALAAEHGVRYLFEASVGGGIPVIRPMTDDLACNRIESVYGILNGTTNFILSEMESRGSDFSQVLTEAQRLGYAEADPSADIDGLDAARKIVILAAIAFGRLLPLDSLDIRGIRDLPSADIAAAASVGCKIKLIAATSTDDDGAIRASVCPCFVADTSPLCHVDGVFNGILVSGDMLGEAMFYGRGAGRLPTASAVASDIVDAIERRSAHPSRLVWEKAQPCDISPLSAFDGMRRVCIGINGVPSLTDGDIPAGTLRVYPMLA